MKLTGMVLEKLGKSGCFYAEEKGVMASITPS